MKIFTPVFVLLTSPVLSLSARADITTIFTQRDVNVGNNFTNPELTESSTVPGLFEADIPNPSGGPTGQNYTLSASASQGTLLTTDQDQLSLTGALGVGTFASVTGPVNSAMFAESYAQAHLYMNITETAVFSLSGIFSGSGAATDFYASAYLFKDGEVAPRAAAGYFQNGTVNLPAGALIGVLEPGVYNFQLALWSNSSAFPTEENETLTEFNSASVSNFNFTVLTVVPEPSAALAACLGMAVLGLRRRRSAA